MFRDAALVKLKKDIDDNLYYYCNSDNNWIDTYFKDKEIDDYLLNTNLEINEFQLKIGDQNFDAENVRIVYSAMKNLLPIHAREEKIWAYLTHTIGYKYMKYRWPITNDQKSISRVNSRYFFQGDIKNVIKNTTVPYVRNGLARLWWAGYIVYDKSQEDPFEYINELFISQDLFVGLCERDIAKNKHLVLAVLKCIRKYDIKNISNNTIVVRNILKQINMEAGLIVLDALDQNEIFSFVEKIFLDNINQSYR